MADEITEYGPTEIARMLQPMRLGTGARLTFHDDLASMVTACMDVNMQDAEFVIEFLKVNYYLVPMKVIGDEKGAYILTAKGMELVRRYL